MSDEQRKEREESKLQIKEELASESAEAPGAESRGRQTIVRAELKTSAEVAGADPFLQTVTFETKEEPSGAY